jgi:hypothetical protein
VHGKNPKDLWISRPSGVLFLPFSPKKNAYKLGRESYCLLKPHFSKHSKVYQIAIVDLNLVIGIFIVTIGFYLLELKC